MPQGILLAIGMAINLLAAYGAIRALQDRKGRCGKPPKSSTEDVEKRIQELRTQIPPEEFESLVKTFSDMLGVKEK